MARHPRMATARKRGPAKKKTGGPLPTSHRDPLWGQRTRGLRPARRKREYRGVRPWNAYPVEPVLQFIIAYKQEHDGNAPPIRCIMDALGLSSTSVTYGILQRLENQGRIRMQGGYGCRLCITVPGGRWVMERAQAAEAVSAGGKEC